MIVFVRVAADAVKSACDRFWVSQVGGTAFEFEFRTVRTGGMSHPVAK
jgi:hypothetical protein